MIQLKASYFLYGIGAIALLFTLGRTYYLFWKMKKERGLGRRKSPRTPPKEPVSPKDE